jgi:penicillin-binding protein 1C
LLARRAESAGGRQQLPPSPGHWLLDESQPPTLLLPGQEGVRGIRFPVWRNERGTGGGGLSRRGGKASTSGRCRWNPGCPRANGVAPAAGGFGGCPPVQTQDAAPLVLSGIREGR